MPIAWNEMKAIVLNRKLHRWAAIITALPVLIVLLSGIILQMKKELDWVQPPMRKGVGNEPILSFDRILDIARKVPETGIEEWKDIDRLDVRPNKGMVKVRAKNRWEIQIDTSTGEVLQVAVRRSDLIESIHDGSFFQESFKIWVFLPSAIILAGIWGTGIYLFIYPFLVKRNRKRKDSLILVHGTESFQGMASRVHRLEERKCMEKSDSVVKRTGEMEQAFN
jgi:uncharacterized iron-regulated membrane protein